MIKISATVLTKLLGADSEPPFFGSIIPLNDKGSKLLKM